MHFELKYLTCTVPLFKVHYSQCDQICQNFATLEIIDCLGIGKMLCLHVLANFNAMDKFSILEMA